MTVETTTKDKQITIDVPEDRVAEFYAFYGHFLAGFPGRRRRGAGGDGSRGSRGPGERGPGGPGERGERGPDERGRGGHRHGPGHHRGHHRCGPHGEHEHEHGHATPDEAAPAEQTAPEQAAGPGAQSTA